MKRKVIVACGGAVATSTMAAEEIKELCADHNIELDLVQCRVNEIETYMDGHDGHPPPVKSKLGLLEGKLYKPLGLSVVRWLASA